MDGYIWHQVKFINYDNELGEQIEFLLSYVNADWCLNFYKYAAERMQRCRPIIFHIQCLPHYQTDIVGQFSSKMYENRRYVVDVVMTMYGAVQLIIRDCVTASLLQLSVHYCVQYKLCCIM